MKYHFSKNVRLATYIILSTMSVTFAAPATFAQNEKNEQNINTNNPNNTKDMSTQRNKQANKDDNKNPQDYAVKPGASTNGWRADEIMDMDVIGQNGDNIGNVKNLLLNEQGQIVAVVAQVGGVWDIGDTHVAVPWQDVSVKDGKLKAPITEKNAGNYSLFKETFFTKYDVGSVRDIEENVDTGPDIWKATDLLNDYVLLETGAGYGYISDLIFDKEGKLQTVEVNASSPTYGYGLYAYPWYGYGYGYTWDPTLEYYVIPYTERDFVGSR